MNTWFLDEMSKSSQTYHYLPQPRSRLWTCCGLKKAPWCQCPAKSGCGNDGPGAVVNHELLHFFLGKANSLIFTIEK
jgi:hypothetical protein